ncbi:MAG: endo alpha-1,4 polygalactosaminidase [Hyphomicrobiaceae bacterium]|nr:endo alpha-1,4 polygalactosaminidase [Hyphomicrobiaceae bacterium]
MPVVPNAATPASPATLAAAAKRRRSLMSNVKSWGYQLAGLDTASATGVPYDLLVVDATTGVGDGNAMSSADVARLQQAADGKRRIVVSYLSIGEAEDYRPDYFSTEYLQEDAPDWLMHENPEWKGNRIISFCDEGWQRTILGDENGRNVYNSIEPSPLFRLIELGLDGVYLDRVDVYSEVGKACPDAARRMVAFVKRLAEQARRRNPDFIVVLQNAEELLVHRDMIDSIDAVAKEDLFYGVDHSEKQNEAGLVRETLANLRLAKRAGRPVFFVDYIKSPAKIADARRRGQAEGFMPYFAPRDLGRMWLPGRDF